MRSFALLLACACATPLPAPEDPGARDAYRAAMVVSAKTQRAADARQRLEELEWDSAREQHTIFAYRHFLAEFEDSRHAPEARQLLDGLRWAAADRDGSAPALSSYLEDHPRGAHAEEAWARLSALRLEAALKSGTAAPLRTWLAENPSAPARERALAALDDLDFRQGGDPRRYLEDHPDGVHRKEAQERVDQTVQAEAELLDEDAAGAYARAAALLDEGKLAQLARRGSAEAARDLAELQKDPRRAALLETAAHKLFLPRATLSDLPDAAPARMQRLREWAAALDGARLHAILGEFGSARASVALAALESAQALLAGLPAAEAALRARRELSALRPVAMGAPQQAAMAILEAAAGQNEAALGAARAAVAADPRCAPAVWLAAQLETEPALRQPALEALRSWARDLAGTHASAAGTGDAAARTDLCAAARAAGFAHAPEARAFREQAGTCAAAPASFAGERLEAAKVLAASGSPLARKALARAVQRDPDARVRAAASGAVALQSAR